MIDLGSGGEVAIAALFAVDKLSCGHETVRGQCQRPQGCWSRGLLAISSWPRLAEKFSSGVSPYGVASSLPAPSPPAPARWAAGLAPSSLVDCWSKGPLAAGPEELLPVASGKGSLVVCRWSVVSKIVVDPLLPMCDYISRSTKRIPTIRYEKSMNVLQLPLPDYVANADELSGLIAAWTERYHLSVDAPTDELQVMMPLHDLIEFSILEDHVSGVEIAAHVIEAIDECELDDIPSETLVCVIIYATE